MFSHRPDKVYNARKKLIGITLDKRLKGERYGCSMTLYRGGSSSKQFPTSPRTKKRGLDMFFLTQ